MSKRKYYHPVAKHANEKEVFDQILFYGFEEEVKKEFQIWAVSWLSCLSCDTAHELYMELVKDDEFTSFYYDGATYTFEISEVQA